MTNCVSRWTSTVWMREIKNATSADQPEQPPLSLGSCLSTRRLSPRKKQDCADSSRQQHYSRASLGNAISLIALISLISLIALIASSLADTRQDRENQNGGYQSTSLANAVTRLGIHHVIPIFECFLKTKGWKWNQFASSYSFYGRER